MSQKYKPGYNVWKINAGEKFDKHIADRTKAQEFVPAEEKPYGSELNLLGRSAYYIEYFENTPLENQNFEPVGTIACPQDTKSFQKGYERAKFLVEHGLIPPEYQDIETKKHR